MQCNGASEVAATETKASGGIGAHGPSKGPSKGGEHFQLFLKAVVSGVLVGFLFMTCI